MATIILTSLKRSGFWREQHPKAFLRTMTMQPQRTIKNLAFMAPREDMVKGHKHHAHPEEKRWQAWAPLTDEQYTQQYRAIWDANIGKIMEWYGILPNDATIILCCYCRPGDFCHRRLVAGWFGEIAEALGVEHELVLD
jgi:uncharacterized protein DUF488